jgi:hypothetical protein
MKMVNAAPESDDGNPRIQRHIVGHAEYQYVYVQHGGELTTVSHERY